VQNTHSQCSHPSGRESKLGTPDQEKCIDNFHTSVQHPVACVIEVTINTASYIILYPILSNKG
jgi:hypothetical protein